MLRLKKYTRINLAYAWFALVILSLLNIFNYADRSIFNSLMDPIKHQFRFSDAQLGWLASAFLLVYAIAAYPLARLADRGMRKAVLVTGVMIWSAATFLTGFSQNFAQLFFARGILGIGEASYATTLAPLLSDYFPASLRSTALGLANAPLGIGTALGYYIGGQSTLSFGWRRAFFYLGVPGIFLGLVALFLREPEMGLGDRAEGKAPVREPATSRAVKTLLKSVSLRYLWASSILLTFSLGGMLVWMASLLHRHYGFSQADADIRGAMAAVIGSVLGICVGGLLGDWLNRYFTNGPIWVVILGYGFSGVFAFLIFQVGGQKAVLFCISMVAFFQMATNGPFLAAMMNVTPPRLRSTCNAIYLFLIHILGDAPSPALIGHLSSTFHDLKRALSFMPWIALASALVMAGALKTYGREKKIVLEGV